MSTFQIEKQKGYSYRVADLGHISAAGGSFTYPESVANGWDGTWETGTRQSPIDLETAKNLQKSRPLQYRRYFKGKVNKVFMRYKFIFKFEEFCVR